MVRRFPQVHAVFGYKMFPIQVKAMCKPLFWMLMGVVLVPALSSGATLQNTDSLSYELTIVETGRAYGSPYTIIENAQVEICFSGCMMTLVASGQTVRVNPNDTVVIDSGVMSVTAGD
jgi:hypothetical protein